MDRQDILDALGSFPYDPQEYWITAGAAMVMYGFREETADIDLGCTPGLAGRLEKDGYLYRVTGDGNRWLRYGDSIELFENWLYGGTCSMDGFRVISTEGLIRLKEELGREKDLRDIELIRQHLGRDGALISLRPMTDEMYRGYFREYENDPDLFREGQEYVRYDHSEENTERYIRRQRDLGRVTLAVMLGEETAGEVIIKNIEEKKCATLGIALRNDRYKNRGIGTQAEKLAVRYVFEEMDIPVLYADSLKTNARSRRVLEKAGFVPFREDEDFVYYRICRDGAAEK